MRRSLPLLAAAFSAFVATPDAFAQETLDVGVLQQSDVSVVQRILYPKEGASELGIAVGWMPFDGYTTTPMGMLSYGMHFSELFGAEVALSGGYSLKNHTYKELESPAYGIQPDAYRFLGAALVDAQFSPIYAKLNWLGKKVIHHDVYVLGGLGATLEQAMMPDASTTVSPTLGLGLGMRFFMKNGNALRVQIRDDLLYQNRVKTEEVQGWFLKQNVGLTFGYSFMMRKG